MRCADASYTPFNAFSFFYLVPFLQFQQPFDCDGLDPQASALSQLHPTTWLNEVNFCPNPRRTWQAATCTVVGLGAEALNNVHNKGAQTYNLLSTCGNCLVRTLGRKRINARMDGMLECVDGTLLGADAITTGTDAMTMGVGKR